MTNKRLKQNNYKLNYQNKKIFIIEKNKALIH